MSGKQKDFYSDDLAYQWLIQAKLGRGREAKYTAKEIAERFQEYVKACIEHPIRQAIALRDGTVSTIPKRRLMTKTAFLVFADLSMRTWGSYLSGTDEEMAFVCEKIDSILKTGMLEGAAVGEFKENLVARITGLADNSNSKQEVVHSGEVAFKLSDLVKFEGDDD